MTIDELKKAGFVEHHKCGGCNAPVGYEMHPTIAAVVFQSGCDCGGTYPNYRLVDWAELEAIRAPTALSPEATQ